MKNLNNKEEVLNNNNKDRKKRTGLKICCIILVFIIITLVSIIVFEFPMGLCDIYEGTAKIVNEIYTEITGDTNKLMPLPIIVEYGVGVDDKPVIYLYPEKEIDIEVKLNNVDFTATYPQYNNGWKVKAKPNGVLVDRNNREYNYLYWEGYSDYNSDISKGFVVAKEDYISFFEEKLEYVGMSDREVCDFISYWLPICNQYDYMLISFQKDYSEKVKIDYSIKPNNELVVFVAFKGLNKPLDIEEQDLSSYKEFKREGFVAVEWGGEIIK